MKPTIERLMLRWQESRERGQTLSPEDLCQDAPELLPELRRRIEALEASRRASRVDFFLGTSPDIWGDDTRLILRPRLFWASAAFLALFTLDLVYEVLVSHAHPRVGIGFALVIITLFLAALFGMLGSREPTLRQLRFFEIALVGLVALYLALYQVGFVLSGRLHYLLDHDRASAVFLYYLDSMVLPWVLLILVYGTYIPNAWRRTAAVVGALAVVPVALGFFTTLTEPTLGASDLSSLAWSTGVWLGFAVPIAIYGAHRIDTARQKELAARRLGQYRLVRKLGQGGMGEVYLAEHQLLRRPCAVKLIRPDRAGDLRPLLRFEREVHAMASLAQANVAEVYDYGHTHDGTFYYVMEYLDGLDLDALVSRHGPVPPERAVHLLRQVCAALRAAHRAGLIHRDIKPGNILLCERGGTPDVVKLVDFGLVRELGGSTDDSKLTQDGAVVGTPLFMAPEQIAGAAELDARTDLYSVGVVAYFLLTGRNAFDRATVRQVFAAHLHEPPIPPRTFNPDIPAELEALVLRCLAKPPTDRPADAEALEKALAACALRESWTEARATEWWALRRSGGKPEHLK